MTARTPLAALFCVLAVVAVCAQTPRPANAKKAVTPQPPIQVTIQAPAPDPESIRQEQRNREREIQIEERAAQTNQRIADYTRILMLVTGLQLVAAAVAAVFSIRAANAAKRSADVAARSLAITQRGHARFTPKRIAYFNPPDIGLVLEYSIDVSGDTGIRIVGGKIRVSCDDPPFDPQLRATKLVADIEPRRVTPSMDERKQVRFHVPLSESFISNWSSGSIVMFVTGEIEYRDAFDINPIHRKFFGYRWTGESQWHLNNVVRNDEEDVED